jgi:hypothetical protein
LAIEEDTFSEICELICKSIAVGWVGVAVLEVDADAISVGSLS